MTFVTLWHLVHFLFYIIYIIFMISHISTRKLLFFLWFYLFKYYTYVLITQIYIIFYDENLFNILTFCCFKFNAAYYLYMTFNDCLKILIKYSFCVLG